MDVAAGGPPAAVADATRAGGDRRVWTAAAWPREQAGVVGLTEKEGSATVGG